MNSPVRNKKLYLILSLPLLAVIFIRPFISEMAYPLMGAYLRIAVLAVFLASLFFSRAFSLNNYFSKPLLACLFALIISLFYSINILSSLHQVYQISALFSLFFLASNMSNKETKKLRAIILFTALLISVYAIYQYVWGFEHLKEYLAKNLKDSLEAKYFREILFTKRAIATFFSPNMLGCYLAMTIPLCAGSILDKINLKKPYIFQSACLALTLTALVLTKSLGVWISLAFGALVFVILSNRLRRSTRLIICALMLLMPAYILFLRFDMFADFANQQNTILQRLSFWKSSLAMIKDFPLTGVGAGNFSNIYLKYKYFLANETMFAHNIFLQAWAETGILGIISIIWLLAAFIKTSFKIEKNLITIGLIASCSVFIVNNMLDFSYFIPQVSFLWWLYLGLLSRARKTDNVKSNNTTRSLALAIVFILILLNIKSAIALNYFQKGEYEKAISTEPYNDLYYAAMKKYNKAIELNPYYPFYHKALALSYLKNGMTKKAILEFEKASSLYPASQYFSQQLYDLYLKTGKLNKAEKQGSKLKKFHLLYSGYHIR